MLIYFALGIKLQKFSGNMKYWQWHETETSNDNGTKLEQWNGTGTILETWIE